MGNIPECKYCTRNASRDHIKHIIEDILQKLQMVTQTSSRLWHWSELIAQLFIDQSVPHIRIHFHGDINSN